MTVNYFNEKAIDWDSDPGKIERAKVFAKEINDFLQLNQTLDAFEFGCGTGLLSYYLKDSFKTITLADNSEGMIKVLQEKIEKESIKNFKPLLIDLFRDEYEKNKYDVVYTLMTLHHVREVDKILGIFNLMLKQGGYLCIGDLDTEDGTFHPKESGFDGHKGFDRSKMNALLLKSGFKVKFYKICHEIKKEENGKIKKYPLFLMIGRK